MAFIETPRFPDDISIGSTGGPSFFTSVVTAPSGYESRNSNWTYARAEYEVGLVNRSATLTRALFAFFNAVAKGQLNGFRYKDYGAGESTGTDEPIGTGTGAEQTLQLVKVYTSGALTYTRPIYKPVSGTVVIKLDGTPTGAFSVNTATGVVTITAGVGDAITATFDFDVPVRLATDDLRVTRGESADAFSWPSILLRETRDIV